MRARYVMATRAHHKLGDISRIVPDLAYVTDEDDEAYIGQWVEGFGYINVRFPKATTRELTDAEREHYDGKRLVIGKDERDFGETRIGPGGEAL
jgi:hypothetical protein